jgi:ADP-ribosyl-[dinitrogen reductase] hydrolase
MHFSKNQILGCIVGGAIGDAMGGPYEGQIGPVSVDFSRPWALSDDTQLTLATCEAISFSGAISPEAIAQRFVDWFVARRVTGMGASTLKALTHLAAGGHWALSGRSGEMAAGNGAAMRIAPLAFCLDPEIEEDRRLIRRVCEITHKNDEASIGALAMVMAIRSAACAQAGMNEYLLTEIASKLPDTRLRDRLIEISACGRRTRALELAERFGSSGYVVHSVPLAVFCARRAAEVPFSELLIEVISAGGDTDTIASMTGQIAGTRLGLANLPREFVERVPDLDEVMAVGREFARKVEARG